MPAFYAHHRFGNAVVLELEGSLAEIIARHRRQFDIGLQGPDLFFFYRPYIGGGSVARYGHHLHDISALPFFERGRAVVKRCGVESGAYGYLLGFICHYILDSESHGLINQMVRETGISHLELEEEFEKYLMRADGLDPLSFPIGDLVPQDRETAAAVAPFYEGISEKVALQALSDLRMVKKLLTAPGALKQGAINTAFRLTFHYRALKGLMNQRKDNPACDLTNREIYRAYQRAVPEALTMLESFDTSLRTGGPLSARFDRNFL